MKYNAVSSNNQSTKKLYQKFRYGLIKRHFYYLTSSVRVLPNFFVIGAGRTGTTSLYHYLNQHPCLTKSAYDELGYFDDNFHLGLNWYRSLFPTKFTQKKVESKHGKFLTYDVTPQYIRRPWAARRISSYFPNAKLIVVLRNPVDKTYSHYNMSTVESNEKRSFEKIITKEIEEFQKTRYEDKDDSYFSTVVEESYLARSFYQEQLEIWFKLFPKKQILVIKSEDLSNKTSKVLQDIFNFLMLPEYEIQDISRHRVSSYSQMNSNVRKTLLEFFRPYNKRLYEFLGRDFGWDR
tara:strand:+ start:451 stop:1329 length:879 start_codon:yes stop_codon:yes gene_type:complete